MKKHSSRHRDATAKLNLSKRKDGQRVARVCRHHLRKQLIYRSRNRDYYTVQNRRRLLKKDLYANRSYSQAPLTISIVGDFGIEDKHSITSFLNTSACFTESTPSELMFDLTNCTRVWPSGVVLLCGLSQWVNLTSTKSTRPIIRSSPSNSDNVNAYLAHCGFYDYVGRGKDCEKPFFADADIVKIIREHNKHDMETREESIYNLVKDHGTMSPDYLELFDSVPLTEAMNNVLEHAQNKGDEGWWILAQRHPRHKIISLCIADNGIGIRNSLMTGPQRDEINNTIRSGSSSDGDFIRLAMEENVSGAVAASLRDEKPRLFGPKRYASGARRGHGLKRIRTHCKELGIPFAILSHRGYIFVSSSGEIAECGSTERRVFPGTLYHFQIRSN